MKYTTACLKSVTHQQGFGDTAARWTKRAVRHWVFVRVFSGVVPEGCATDYLSSEFGYPWSVHRRCPFTKDWPMVPGKLSRKSSFWESATCNAVKCWETSKFEWRWLGIADDCLCRLLCGTAICKLILEWLSGLEVNSLCQPNTSQAQEHSKSSGMIVTQWFVIYADFSSDPVVESSNK